VFIVFRLGKEHARRAAETEAEVQAEPVAA
jgi:hypothetical protein